MMEATSEAKQAEDGDGEVRAQRNGVEHSRSNSQVAEKSKKKRKKEGKGQED